MCQFSWRHWISWEIFSADLGVNICGTYMILLLSAFRSFLTLLPHETINSHDCTDMRNMFFIVGNLFFHFL